MKEAESTVDVREKTLNTQTLDQDQTRNPGAVR